MICLTTGCAFAEVGYLTNAGAKVGTLKRSVTNKRIRENSRNPKKKKKQIKARQSEHQTIRSPFTKNYLLDH
jgi:hypothetical protein